MVNNIQVAEREELLAQVKHLQGDRQDFDGLKEKLKGTNFNIVYDINGKTVTSLNVAWLLKNFLVHL